MNTSGPIAIIVAVNREAAQILDQLTVLKTIEKDSASVYECRYHKSQVIVAVCGIGKEKTTQGLTFVIDTYHPSLVISLGFAGAVVPELKKGDIIVGEKILSQTNITETYLSHSELVTMVNNALDTSRVEYTNGCIMTVSEPIFNPKHKTRLSKEYGCQAIEMETAIVARIAMESNISFISIRFILDELHDDLSSYFNFISKKNKHPIACCFSFLFSFLKIIKARTALNKCLDRSQQAIYDSVKPVLNQICKADNHGI
ncbi:MAG: hypothetical protein ABIJ59_13310 [Pseudomonadota bacterium]